MDCAEARAGLWPPEHPRLVGDEVAAARLHIEGCDDCAEYFEQDRALLDLYDRVRRHPAPLDVRESVFNALSRARWAGVSATSPPRPNWMRLGAWPLAIAASLAVIMLAELRPTTPASADDPAMFVEDYLRRAVGQDHMETDDPNEVRRFLQRELGMQLQPLRFAGLVLERVEICLLEGRRGAMIVYRKDGAEVSHYLVPREGTGQRAPALSEGAGGVGVPVVTWSTTHVEQALVGEITSEQLLEIATRGSSDDERSK